MKAVSYCLAQEPRFNSQLSADGESLQLNADINLGIAVDTADGLVAPVIQQVDQQGIRSLAKTLSEKAQRARDGKLSPADFKGGSFTISNLGGIGGQHFTPIINAPEVGILGLGQARWQLKRIGPPQQQGEIEDRLIQPLALSYDHRVIDGAVAARFIALLKQSLEDLRKILL
jgi:pyruvate dehydrogenase E2 component (dihydrolipoamide acetyltransferase)